MQKCEIKMQQISRLQIAKLACSKKYSVLQYCNALSWGKWYYDDLALLLFVETNISWYSRHLHMCTAHLHWLNEPNDNCLSDDPAGGWKMENFYVTNCSPDWCHSGKITHSTSSCLHRQTGLWGRAVTFYFHWRYLHITTNNQPKQTSCLMIVCPGPSWWSCTRKTHSLSFGVAHKPLDTYFIK